MNKFLFFFIIIIFKTGAQTSVLKLADSLYTYGKYSKAIKQYKLLENQKEVFYKIAKSYVAIGNYDAALKTYEQNISDSSENELAKYEYGKLLLKTKKYKGAENIFKNLIYHDSINPNYHYEFGIVLERLKDSSAIVSFKKTFQLDSTHQKAIYKLAKHFIKKGKNTLADTYIDIGLSEYENNKELISLKAQNFFIRRDYTKAIIWFEKLLSLNESSEFIHEKLSLSYAMEMAYEKAIEHMLIALEYDPHNTVNLFKLSTFYLEINDFDNAEKVTKTALKILDRPLNKEYSALGKILIRQKKFKEAINIYNKAVKEHPLDQEANFFLIFTKDQYYKDFDTRIKLYEQYKEKFPKSTFNSMVEYRISELKKEKFLKKD